MGLFGKKKQQPPELPGGLQSAMHDAVLNLLKTACSAPGAGSPEQVVDQILSPDRYSEAERQQYLQELKNLL